MARSLTVVPAPGALLEDDVADVFPCELLRMPDESACRETPHRCKFIVLSASCANGDFDLARGCAAISFSRCCCSRVRTDRPLNSNPSSEDADPVFCRTACRGLLLCRNDPGAASPTAGGELADPGLPPLGMAAIANDAGRALRSIRLESVSDSWPNAECGRRPPSAAVSQDGVIRPSSLMEIVGDTGVTTAVRSATLDNAKAAFA